MKNSCFEQKTLDHDNGGERGVPSQVTMVAAAPSQREPADIHQHRHNNSSTSGMSFHSTTSSNDRRLALNKSSSHSKKSHHHSVLARSDQYYKQHLQLSKSIRSLETSHHKSQSVSSARPPPPQAAAAASEHPLTNSTKSSSGGALHTSDHDEHEHPDDYDVCVSHLDTCIDFIQQFRYRCGVFVNSKHVQLFVVYLIAINAVMMGIGTFDFVTENPAVQHAFEITDLVFLIVFTIELGMQFAFYGWHMLTDGWLLFDTVIIIMSWSFIDAQIIRAFRIFRANRLITRIKVLKNLVRALFGVMPRMIAICLLLMLVSYIFAVMFTQLFKDLYERGLTDEDYFGRMDKTLFTLFQLMTLDSWADVARQVMDVYDWAWLPFIVFVVITGFVVVNLIIAVICDAISALRDDEKAKLHGTYEKSSHMLAEDGDEDSNGDESGDGSGSSSDSSDSAADKVGVHLDTLEDQMDELARMQEESLMALDALTRQLQNQNLTELPQPHQPTLSSTSTVPVEDDN